MDERPAISVEGVGKRYDIGKAPALLSEQIGGLLSRRRGAASTSGRRESFWALRDVSLEIERGEVVGLIGANGAGKSTLMKLMANITYPTEGQIRMRGRVGTLLEVGTGFNPELSGRENVYLSGTILGMKRREIHARYNEIVEFSGIERFIETPVKRYSSGMYVRLGFAVAAHLTPEILLVDEVLAVGDADFQRRCLAKMQDVVDEGRTIVFVSHSMHSVQRICARAYWIDGGRIAAEGQTSAVVAAYLQRADAEQDGGTVEIPESATRVGTGEARFVRAQLRDDTGTVVDRIVVGQRLSMIFTVIVSESIADGFFEIGVADPSGGRVVTATSADFSRGLTALDAGETAVTVSLPGALLPGEYSIDIGLHRGSLPIHSVDYLEGVLAFDVDDNPGQPAGVLQGFNPRGTVRLDSSWSIGQDIA